MNPHQAGIEIATTLPELKDQIARINPLNTALSLMEIMRLYTHKMIVEHNDIAVEKGMILIDHLYCKGDGVVKNAIENIFLFSLDALVFSCNAIERKQVFSKIPASLYQAYIKQIYTAGI